MFRIVLVISLICVAAGALRSVDKPYFKKLKNSLKKYKTSQDKIYKMINQLELDLIDRIDNLAVAGGSTQNCPPTGSSKCTSFQGSLGDINLDSLETRLESIENDMDEIMLYLSAEKKTDIVLKQKSDKVITEMKGKVKETDEVILALQLSVSETMKKFEDKIHNVNRSAQVTINSKGVIFYSEIGSPCTHDDECLTENSDCRSRKCQCSAGWSYNMDDRSCVETCRAYGITYQTADNYIIRGYNNLTLEDVESIDVCKERCNTENDFLCKTIDYFPRWKECYLSAFTKLDVPDNSFEYNSAGIHLQRDCE